MAVIIRPIRHLAGYRKYDVGRRTFLTNLLKSLQSTNPLLEIIDRICRQEETSIENDNKAALKTLQWKDVQPQHVASASKTLKERLDSQMDQIIMSKNQQIASQDIQKTLTSLDQAFAPSKTLQYAITLLSVVKDKEWTSFIDYVPTRRLETQLIDNIETAAQKTDDTEARRAADHLVSGDIDLLEPASDAHTRRDDLRDALGQFSVELVSASPNLSNSTIGNMYQWLGIRTELAKLSGHKCVVDQVFPHRMASLQQIQELHLRVRDRVLPHVYDPQETPDSDLVDLLGMSGTPMGASSGRRADDPKRMDEKTMLRLERHVTLDGALVFCFRLCGVLFGVEVVEESLSPGQLWDKDARLFHVHDRNNQSYIGSFYLDPFQRGGKFRRPVTVPVVPRGLNQCPVLCMSLTIQSPTWDTDPAALSWEDAEALLHEFGHVIDFLLSPNAYGSIAGPVETLPFDRSELLPKVCIHVSLVNIPQRSSCSCFLLFLSTVYGAVDDGKINPVQYDGCLEESSWVFG